MSNHLPPERVGAVTFVFTTLIGTIKLFASVLAFVMTPLGMVTAGLTALAAVWAHNTGALDREIKHWGELFKWFGQLVGSVFTGIKNASVFPDAVGASMTIFSPNVISEIDSS